MSRIGMLLSPILVGFCVLSNTGQSVRADEIAGTLEARESAAWRATAIEMILADWLKAARECRSYDAKFTRWEYDPIFGDSEKPRRVVLGRILFQRNGASRYEVKGSDGFIWRDDEFGVIDWVNQRYRYYGKLDLEAVRKLRRAPWPKNLGFWESLAYASSFLPYLDQTDVMPFLLDPDQGSLRCDFDFHVVEATTEKFVLAAVLKSDLESGRLRLAFERIDFAFRKGESLPYAVCLRSTNNRRMVYEFHDPLINDKAPDAEAFLSPDLSEFERIDLGEQRPKLR